MQNVRAIRRQQSLNQHDFWLRLGDPVRRQPL